MYFFSSPSLRVIRAEQEAGEQSHPLVAYGSGAGKASSFAVAFCSVPPDRRKQTSGKASQVKDGLTNLSLTLAGFSLSISALENNQGDGSSSQVEQDPAGTSWYLQHKLF